MSSFPEILCYIFWNILHDSFFQNFLTYYWALKEFLFLLTFPDPCEPCASVCFGLVSKRERLVNKIKANHVGLRGLSATEGLVSLQSPTQILERLIISARALYSCNRLDIAYVWFSELINGRIIRVHTNRRHLILTGLLQSYRIVRINAHEKLAFLFQDPMTTLRQRLWYF